MYGNYGRRSPSPLRNPLGGLRRGGGRIIPPPPPPPPPSEPDRDEAFVQETGIKVFTSRPPRMVQRVSVEEDSVEDSMDGEEVEDEHEDSEDDCYEMIMDDAILEEDGEEDEDEDDDDEDVGNEHGGHHKGKEAGKNGERGDGKAEPHKEKIEAISKELGSSDLEVLKISNGMLQPGEMESLQISQFSKNGPNNRSSSGVSSNGSSGSMVQGSSLDSSVNSAFRRVTPLNLDDAGSAPGAVDQTRKLDAVGKENCQKCVKEGSKSCPECLSPNQSSSDMSRSSSGGSGASVKLGGSLSTSLRGLNTITSSQPTVVAQPTFSSAHTTPTKEHNDFIFRGKPNRLSLPMRDRYITRESNPGPGDPSQRAGKEVVRPVRTIWFRRPKPQPMDPGTSGQPGTKGQVGTKGPQTVGYANKTANKKEDGGAHSADEAGPSAAPHRQRSGTWSLANSRRRRERDDEVRSFRRQRHNSGDDIHRLATADETLIGGAAPPLASPTPLRGSTLPGRGPLSPGVSNRRRGGDSGFFDSIRPRSKSDAKAILAGRQRRRSGEEPPPPRKAPPTPPLALLDAIRPRSKSDAARLANKRPNIMTNIRNAVQHTLVSPGGAGERRGGRRSGESTPPLEQQRGGDYHHYTWHGGEKSKPSSLSKVLDLFRSRDPEDKKRRSFSGKGDRSRRNSGERVSSGSLSNVYIRGVDPVGAAATFRDSRGLPQADTLKYCFEQEEESQILVKFFKLHRSYDLIPTSAKLVIFDTSLQVKKAFYALVHNGVRAAPLWDHERQRFVGMLTITDFIRILHCFHHNRDPQMEVLEEHRLHMWRTFLKDENRPLVSISPDESLFEAIRILCQHKIHRLPVVDPSTGNVLYIITHKRILKFLYLYINELPKPLVLQKTVGELELGTYTNIETATHQTLIIEALDKFVKHRISALPIVDAEGKLLDIYAKFDVINLAAGGTYNKLDVTLAEANEYRNEWFEGVLHCKRSEKLCTIMDRIVRAEVHRLVVVDDEKRVIGVVSLSDILHELVLKPSELSETLASPLKSPVADVSTADVTGDVSSPDVSGADAHTDARTEVDSPTPASPTPLSPAPLSPAPPSPTLASPPSPTHPSLTSPPSHDSEDEGRFSMEKSESG